jgi:tetratricopeptide (TPR) repeat protein
MNLQSKKRVTMDEFPRFSQKLKLVCQRCGQKHAYDVGTILYRTEGKGESAVMHYAFSSYFRCRDCAAAGPWEIADNLKVFGMALAAVATGSDKRIVAAMPVLFDGTTHQSPAMGEEHLLQLLRQDPRSAFLHTRLGNLLRCCGEKARAAEWYETALALDPGDIEARYNLFCFARDRTDDLAALQHTLLLVRHLLDGRKTNKDDLTRGIAYSAADTLRQLPPEIRAELLARPEVAAESRDGIFIRTLLEQSGEEEAILHDAADRLLNGQPVPAQTSFAVAEMEIDDDVDERAPDLVPSLHAVVKHQGLDPESLSVAVDTDDKGYIHVPDRHSVLVSDGEKTAVWLVSSLRELFRGNKLPPPDIDHYPPEYAGYFFSLEKHVLAVCDAQGDRTDQEMEPIFSALRRRPDGKNHLGPTHDYLWQATALTLGSHVLSQAEFQAILGRLERSVRSWAQRPISRNYVQYLRKNLL